MFTAKHFLTFKKQNKKFIFAFKSLYNFFLYRFQKQLEIRAIRLKFCTFFEHFENIKKHKFALFSETVRDRAKRTKLVDFSKISKFLEKIWDHIYYHCSQ